MEAKSQILEWLVVLSFFVAAVGLTFAEAAWIKRRKWASFGNGFAYSSLSNFVGLTLSSIILFIALTGFFMAAWDGSLNKLPSANFTIGALMILVAILVVMVLALCKWLVLKLLKIQSGKTAWIFSFINSVLTLFLVFLVPILFGYILFR